MGRPTFLFYDFRINNICGILSAPRSDAIDDRNDAQDNMHDS
jgi:hypothetical protein